MADYQRSGLVPSPMAGNEVVSRDRPYVFLMFGGAGVFWQRALVGVRIFDYLSPPRTPSTTIKIRMARTIGTSSSRQCATL